MQDERGRAVCCRAGLARVLLLVGSTRGPLPRRLPPRPAPGAPALEEVRRRRRSSRGAAGGARPRQPRRVRASGAIRRVPRGGGYAARHSSARFPHLDRHSTPHGWSPRKDSPPRRRLASPFPSRRWAACMSRPPASDTYFLPGCARAVVARRIPARTAQRALSVGMVRSRTTLPGRRQAGSTSCSRRSQLVIQHFMFSRVGGRLPSCSWAADEISDGRLRHLADGDTTSPPSRSRRSRRSRPTRPSAAGRSPGTPRRARASTATSASPSTTTSRSTTTASTTSRTASPGYSVFLPTATACSTPTRPTRAGPRRSAARTSPRPDPWGARIRAR